MLRPGRAGSSPGARLLGGRGDQPGAPTLGTASVAPGCLPRADSAPEGPRAGPGAPRVCLHAQSLSTRAQAPAARAPPARPDPSSARKGTDATLIGDCQTRPARSSPARAPAGIPARAHLGQPRIPGPPGLNHFCECRTVTGLAAAERQAALPHGGCGSAPSPRAAFPGGGFGALETPARPRGPGTDPALSPAPSRRRPPSPPLPPPPEPSARRPPRATSVVSAAVSKNLTQTSPGGLSQPNVKF